MTDILTKKKLEELVLYIKLFVGMGLNWYLEIAVWAMGSRMEESVCLVVVDCVNMLQVKYFKQANCLQLFQYCRDSGCS